jgi:hypothetical protein
VLTGIILSKTAQLLHFHSETLLAAAVMCPEIIQRVIAKRRPQHKSSVDA